MLRTPSFAILFVSCFPFVAAAVGAPPSSALLFEDVRVFDGRRVFFADVLVRDGEIAAVGKQLARPRDRSVTVVAGKGRTLLPGLIDAHTHAGEDARPLRQALVFGVTLELDMFGPVEILRASRQREAAHETTVLADLRGAGVLATVPGGHGTEYGIPIPTLTLPAQAQAFVDARIAEGSDFIKIVYDHGPTPPMPSLDRPTMAALVAAAHARKRLAVVHVATEDDATDAVAAGADGLMHLFIDRAPDAAFVRAVKARGSFVVPTLTVLARHCEFDAGGDVAHDPRLSPYLGPDEVRRLLKRYKGEDRPCFSLALETVRQLRAAGVQLLAGTDSINAGTAHGASLHGELMLLVKAGLTPTEALVAATSAPATAFQLDGRGRIAAGARADLVLVEGDPTSDIRSTRNIVGVWKRGVQVDRAAFQRSLTTPRP